VALMLDTMAARVGGAPVHVAVNHADEPAEAERLMQAIRERFTCRELLLADMTPGMGVHAGPGVLGIGFYVET
jgi:fatty acid-binding protein DegV